MASPPSTIYDPRDCKILPMHFTTISNLGLGKAGILPYSIRRHNRLLAIHASFAFYIAAHLPYGHTKKEKEG